VPVAVTPMGKGTVNETLNNFIGVYAGKATQPDVRQCVESADLVLCIEPLKSDLNTMGFSWNIQQGCEIDIHANHVTMDSERFDDLHIKGVLDALINELSGWTWNDVTTMTGLTNGNAAMSASPAEESFPPEAITHEYLWPRIGSWLEPNDILLTETGTAYLGAWSAKLPENVSVISQVLWGSIGFTLPAAQGAALAARELGQNQRVILFEGDGSFQITGQEVSTMLRHKLPIIIFLIENDGYTIERYVHGMEAEYNDLQKWRYSEFPRAMGATEQTARSYRISSKAELEQLLADPTFRSDGLLHFVEMSMPWDDAPENLKLMTADAAKANKRR
jgi:pyruvate decarboxylase